MIDPFLQSLIRVDTIRSHIHEIPKDTPSEVHRFDMGGLQSRIIELGASPDQRPIAYDPTTHVPIEHERKTTKHFFLSHFVISQYLSYTGRESFIVDHEHPPWQSHYTF